MIIIVEKVHVKFSYVGEPDGVLVLTETGKPGATAIPCRG